MRKWTLLIITCLTLLAGCGSTDPWVKLKGQKIYVEVEEDPAYQSLGLMFRTSLKADHGMLFIYSSERYMSFWMKNTKIPLDILYFDGDLKLVTLIDSALPCRTETCPSYPSTEPARYVLEINGGLARQWGVQTGDLMELNLAP